MWHQAEEELVHLRESDQAFIFDTKKHPPLHRGDSQSHPWKGKTFHSVKLFFVVEFIWKLCCCYASHVCPKKAKWLFWILSLGTFDAFKATRPPFPRRLSRKIIFSPYEAYLLSVKGHYHHQAPRAGALVSFKNGHPSLVLTWPFSVFEEFSKASWCIAQLHFCNKFPSL